MTDRQKLFEFFAQEHGLSLLESQMDDIINEVDAYQKKWVKCSERMPKVRTEVLAWHPDWNVEIAFHRFPSEGIMMGLTYDKAIYWMPKPDPPMAPLPGVN